MAKPLPAHMNGQPKRERTFRLVELRDDSREAIRHWLAVAVMWEQRGDGTRPRHMVSTKPMAVFHNEPNAERYCREMMAGLCINEAFGV